MIGSSDKAIHISFFGRHVNKGRKHWDDRVDELGVVREK